jgi:hypothetical protein
MLHLESNVPLRAIALHPQAASEHALQTMAGTVEQVAMER